jgi:IS1 family transposase
MANKRLSKEKQALVLAALCEGTPINAVTRMFKTGKHAVLRVIRETGEAFVDHMDAHFRDLPCLRIEMDEQWQYVGCHAGRMVAPEKERGDFWLWACIDADTKLVFSHKIGKRDWWTGYSFVEDVRSRVAGPVQIATDNLPSYAFHIRTHKLAVAIHFGVYNYVRRHHTLGTTPAVAAGLEEKPWSLEQVVEMTAVYWDRKKSNAEAVTAIGSL